MEQLVFPGDFLSREEEFSAGKNTYVGPSGRICSDSVGVPDFDKETREVSVSKKARVVKALGPGSVVLGKVLLVKENVVVLGLFEATHSGEERKMLHSSGTIMISRASTDFVKSLKQEFKVGDLVRAKVVSQNNYGTELSTEGRELGVVKAFCTRCRNPMQLFGAQLKCTSCGSVERRKLAERYMEKQVLEILCGGFVELVVLKSEKNIAEFLIKGERHTLPNLLRSTLLKNPDVEFAAYSLKHPTDKEARFIVRTKSKSPSTALNAACKEMGSGLEELDKALKKALK